MTLHDQLTKARDEIADNRVIDYFEKIYLLHLKSTYNGITQPESIVNHRRLIYFPQPLNDPEQPTDIIN